MFIRSGIAANDNNLDEMRTEINGWFAEVAATIEAVPRSGVLGKTTRPTILAPATGNYTVPHPFKERPTYVLGATLESGGQEDPVVGTQLGRTTDRWFSVRSTRFFGVTDAIFVLMFLERTIARERRIDPSGTRKFSPGR